MNNRKVYALLVAALAYAGVAEAQGAGTSIEPSPSRFLVHAPDYRSIEDRWTGAVGVAQWWVNKLAEDRLGKSIQMMVNDAVKEAKPIIEWTGHGVLYELRVATNTAADDAGWYVATIVAGKATKAGVGSTPEQALFSRFSQDYWQAGIPPGYVLDPVYSGFFWVSQRPNGEVKAEVVRRGTVNGLVERVRAHYGDLEVKYQSEKIADKEAWLRVANTAKAKLQNQAARAAIDAALTTVVESQSRVAEINGRLNTALMKEAAATKALTTLQILKTVFDAAQLVEVAMNETGEPAARFANAKTPEAVVKVVEEIQTQNGAARREIELRFQENTTGLQDALDRLWNRVAPANPPQDAGQALELKRKR